MEETVQFFDRNGVKVCRVIIKGADYDSFYEACWQYGYDNLSDGFDFVW